MGGCRGVSRQGWRAQPEGCLHSEATPRLRWSQRGGPPLAWLSPTALAWGGGGGTLVQSIPRGWGEEWAPGDPRFWRWPKGLSS